MNQLFMSGEGPASGFCHPGSDLLAEFLVMTNVLREEDGGAARLHAVRPFDNLLRCCLDVGHAHLFSDKQFSFDYWLRTLEPWLTEVHMNNNNGILDEHHGFDWERGVLDYQTLLPKIRATNNNLDLVLEMDLVQDMRDSLYYFRIEEPA